MEIEISRHLQRPNENSYRYITDLQTLTRLHGSIIPEQELHWWYRNLLPEYRQYIRKSDITGVVTLSKAIQEVDLLLSKLKSGPWTSHTRYYPPTEISVSTPSEPPPYENRIPPATDKGYQQIHSKDTVRLFRHICWRSGKTGHGRADCQGPANLFRSRCEKTEVMSRDCHCNRSRSGN